MFIYWQNKSQKWSNLDSQKENNYYQNHWNQYYPKLLLAWFATPFLRLPKESWSTGWEPDLVSFSYNYLSLICEILIYVNISTSILIHDTYRLGWLLFLRYITTPDELGYNLIEAAQLSILVLNSWTRTLIKCYQHEHLHNIQLRYKRVLVSISCTTVF